MRENLEADAAAQLNFQSRERYYIFKNMRPANIGIWEWRLMFDKLVLHNNFVDAMKDAKEMARELHRSTIVKYSTFYYAEPSDYWDGKYQIGVGTRYEQCNWHFLKLLVVHGKYPLEETIDGIASRHYYNYVIDEHKNWKQKYTALSDSAKLNFDRGNCQRPFPEGFWTNEVYHAALDAISAIEMTDRKNE